MRGSIRLVDGRIPEGVYHRVLRAEWRLLRVVGLGVLWVLMMRLLQGITRPRVAKDVEGVYSSLRIYYLAVNAGKVVRGLRDSRY
ncbi:MAG: hypothetical protein LM583_09210 [Desulfurococcaceae archaeon]|nr:hypothetical protein [Desulfurococcaceae archaeon]